jgi:uncharacterized membrane protein (DUF373 family)
MHKKTATLIHKILHFFEGAIAVLTLFVLVFMLGTEIYRMFTIHNYFSTINIYLHNILTLVVGLEFVRMLLDMTPANTLEVLIVAIARQVILTHDNPWSNVASVLCIAGLFAIRRFLIPKGEMTVELSEMGEEEIVENAFEDDAEAKVHSER